jgi:hypothetical protein
MKTFRTTSATMICGLLSLAAAAQADTQVTGTVQMMQSLGGLASAPGNADLRIWLNGLPPICPGATDTSWAYINSNDPNFKGVLATVSMAYAMGKSLTMVTRLTPIGAGNYCQIVSVMVSG